MIRYTLDGETAWSEWHWSATGLNMAGVAVFGVREERIVWGRLYMESVEEDGEDIDEAMQSMTEKGQRAGVDHSEEASPT